jgi:hypothetical protein
MSRCPAGIIVSMAPVSSLVATGNSLEEGEENRFIKRTATPKPRKAMRRALSIFIFNFCRKFIIFHNSVLFFHETH